MFYVIAVTKESEFNSKIQGFCSSNPFSGKTGYIFCKMPSALIDLGYELISGPSWDPKEECFLWTFKK